VLQSVTEHYGALWDVMERYGSIAEALWGVVERYGTLWDRYGALTERYRTVTENIDFARQ